MKQVLPVVLFFLAACTSSRMELAEATLNDTLQTTQQHGDATKDYNGSSDTIPSTDEDDCIFNNDYKGLTLDWLAKLKKTNFIWREDLSSALLPQGQDTVYLSQGGCTHYGFSVELKRGIEPHEVADSAYWVEKALQLADEYGMEHYSNTIREKGIRIVQNTKGHLWFEVDDDNEEDNIYYGGIEVTREGSGVRLSISHYFN